MLYDGACPLCHAAARTARVKAPSGTLHLLDARTCHEDPLYQEVSRRGLDLNEGMVVFADGEILVGAEAMAFVARYGEPSHPLTRIGRLLFRWNGTAHLIYPFLRTVRNAILRLIGVKPIGH